MILSMDERTLFALASTAGRYHVIDYYSVVQGKE